MDWGEYALAFAAFFLTHSLPVRPPLRPWLVARLGAGGFAVAYSALSLCALAWLVGAAGRAPHVPLWDWHAWANHAVLAVMLPVCLILALAIGRPNPFSFGGARNDTFDPMRPGLVRWTRHPLLVALALWSGVHMLPNGDVAHVILFATFAAFAIMGGRIVDRRKRREMGGEWHRLQAAVADAPAVARPGPAGLTARIMLGVALYLALIWAHPMLFGVSPLP
jgi:uncharacterized membrane protein